MGKKKDPLVRFNKIKKVHKNQSLSTMYLSPTTKRYPFNTLKIKYNLLIISHLLKGKFTFEETTLLKTKSMKYYKKTPV